MAPPASSYPHPLLLAGAFPRHRFSTLHPSFPPPATMAEITFSTKEGRGFPYAIHHCVCVCVRERAVSIRDVKMLEAPETLPRPWFGDPHLEQRLFLPSFFSCWSLLACLETILKWTGNGVPLSIQPEDPNMVLCVSLTSARHIQSLPPKIQRLCFWSQRMQICSCGSLLLDFYPAFLHHSNSPKVSFFQVLPSNTTLFTQEDKTEIMCIFVSIEPYLWVLPPSLFTSLVSLSGLQPSWGRDLTSFSAI